MTFSNYPPPNSIHIISIGHYWQLAHTIVFAIALLASGALDHVSVLQSEDVLTIVFKLFDNATSVVLFKMVIYHLGNTLMSKCKISYAFGCGGILLVTILPFVIGCFSESSTDINISVYFFSITRATVTYYFFIYPVKSKCKLSYKRSHFIICLAVLLIIAGAGLVSKMSTNLEYDWISVLVGSAYSGNALFSMVSLISIYKNQFELTVKDEGCYNDPIDGKFIENTKDHIDDLAASTPESEDRASSGEIQKKPIDMECGMCMQKFDATTDPESKDEKDEVKYSAVEETSSGEIQKNGL